MLQPGIHAYGSLPGRGGAHQGAEIFPPQGHFPRDHEGDAAAAGLAAR